MRNTMTRQKTLVSSPYTSDKHLLDLSRLDPIHQEVAISLSNFGPVSQNYARDDYLASFNVAAIVSQVQKNTHIHQPVRLYVVAFRLKLKAEIAGDPEKTKILYDADRLSHAEASALGGLLKYWYGAPDHITGHNLATCWWRNAEDARAGGHGALHRASVAKVQSWYELWRVEQYELELGANYWNWRQLQ